MTPERTTEGKLVIYRVSTGHRFERWSVDARDMLLSGDYTADPSHCQMAAATVAPAPAAPPAPLPTEHSPGVPLVVTHSADATPAALPTIPTRQPARGKRGS
jgi:hypothetical protein